MIDNYPRRVLVLYWDLDPKDVRAAVEHHLRVLDYAKTKHHIFYHNTIYGVPRWLRRLDFDAVILQKTFLCMRWSHLFSMWKRRSKWIKDLACVKIALPQDEYNYSEVLDEWLAELGVSVIFTAFDESHRDSLYPIMAKKATFRKCFTGYIDDRSARQYATKLLPSEKRPNDIVYRATHNPYWLGSHGQLKHRIADVIVERATAHELKCDISTRWEDTVFGVRWLDFLMSGRVVIGCEGGSSVLDHRGEIQAQIREMLRDDPSLSFEEVSARFPVGWDQHQFFAISPRHFEAIITKTCQILVEGRYEGVLYPDKHYIPLKRDLSNVDEVLEKIKDQELIRRMADQAYEDIYLSGLYTYRRLAAEIEQVLVENQRRRRRDAKDTYLGMLWKITGPVAASQTAVGLRMGRLVRLGRPLSGVVRGRRNSLVKGLVALQLIMRVRGLRRLLFAYLRDYRALRSVDVDQVLADLMRLSILGRAQTDKLTSDWPFRLAVHFDPDAGLLILKSLRVDPNGTGNPSAKPHPPERLNWGVVGATLHANRLKNMLWDHSALGLDVSYALNRSRSVSIPLGERGVYRFKAIV
ncbi:MAG: hypothetical protein ACE5E2_06295, partial [Candidatus Binatia bacterium]